MELASRYVKLDFKDQTDFEQNFHFFGVPEHFNFGYDIIDEYARLAPSQLAMVWCNPAGEEHHFTFADMKRMSDKCANYFSSMGFKKGDRVMLVLKRRYEFWVCTLALIKLGCVIIPATYQLAKKDIVYRCNMAGISGCVAVNDDEICGHFESAKKEAATVKYLFTLGEREGWENLSAGIENASENFTRPEDKTDNGDMMMAYFTSGTTGMPKLAVHSYTYPLGQIPTAAYWHNVNDKTLHVAVADTGWAKCGWGKIFGQWICGTALFVYDMDKFIPRDLIAEIAKHHVTNFCAPPTIYNFMLKENLEEFDLSSLKWANTAGEALNPEVYNKFYERTGVKMYEAFGQSETTPLLMTSKWMEPQPGSSGRPSPQYDIDLVDDDGKSVDDGEEGEIVVRLDKGYPIGLFIGYYNDDAKNKEVFRDKMYHTGDMAWRDVHGYYHFVGRGDDVIKSSGYRIGPFEVESALMEHPAVLECAITAVPDPVRVQLVKATIVLNKGFEPSPELVKELQNHVKRTTAPYKYPRIVEFVDQLPKTISGKIQRVKLRHLDENKRIESEDKAHD